ncbi:MAG: family 16 glycosylhydrolase [Porticoccaceae bacterium]
MTASKSIISPLIAALGFSLMANWVAADIHSPVVWAVNVGGGQFNADSVLQYQADDCDEKHLCLNVPAVEGTQVQPLYKSYRTGELLFSQPMDNGVYDLTLHFMEPEDLAKGERLFDVLAQGDIVIGNLDVRSSRDGRMRSALSRTIPNIQVTEGQFEISLKSLKGLPVISGFEVRQRQSTGESAWTMLWQDEFDQDGSVNADKWNIETWPARKVNDEDQTYTTRAKNLRIEDGLLIIEAHKEDYAGAKYSSARVNSAGKMDILYGKIEVRARLPKGQGSWPAIWMMPTDPYRYATNCGPSKIDWQGNGACDAWPNSGEIDIMEHVGYDHNIVHGTVHTKDYVWVHWSQRKGSIKLEDVDKNFYRYGLEWTPDSLTTTVNDIPYFTYYRDSDDWASWPFNHPFHVILNLAIGGNWGRAGGPIDNSAFPMRLEIDYVRAYRATAVPQ